MRLWRDHAQEFLNEMIRHEGLRNNCSRREPQCVECGVKFSFDDGLDEGRLPSQRVMQCRDCFHSPILCGSCCLRVHERLPLHVIQVSEIFFINYNSLSDRDFLQEYTGVFWRRMTLYDLGHSMQLGHGHLHSPCYSPGPPLDITVLDSSGIHRVKIRFCECQESSFTSKRVQLLRAGWYPASLTDPESCATFCVLEEFHMLHLSGALNAHAFIQALERRTDSSRIEFTLVSPFMYRRRSTSHIARFIGSL